MRYTPDFGLCTDGKTPDEQIAACTRVLGNKKVTGDKRATAFGNRGYAYLMKSDFDRAIEDLDEAITVSPRYPFALRARSEAYRKLGQFEAAIKDANAALSIDPEDGRALMVRGAAQMYAGRHQEALTDLDKALVKYPKSVFALHIRAKTYRLLGQCAKAVADINRSGEIEALDYHRLEDRALCARQLGDTKLALDDLGQMLKIDPNSIVALQRRGMLRIDLKKYSEAMADGEAIIRLDPSKPEGYSLRGEAHRLEGRAREALADFEMALSKDPNNVYALISRGEVNHSRGRFFEAVADFTKALEKSPKNIYALEQRARSQEQLGKWQKAIEDYSTIILTAPTNTKALVNRAHVYRRLGDYEKALADYDKAIEAEGDNYDAYLARAYHRMEREPDKAIADLKKIDQSKFSDFLSIHLAMAYESAGKNEAALAEFDRWIDQAGLNAIVFLHRAGFYVRAGKFDEALADIEKAHQLQIKENKPSKGDSQRTPAACFRIWTLYLKGDKDKAAAQAKAYFSESRTDNLTYALDRILKSISWKLDGDCYSAHALLLVEQGKSEQTLAFLDQIGNGNASRHSRSTDDILLYARAAALEARGQSVWAYRDYLEFASAPFLRWDGKRLAVVARERASKLEPEVKVAQDEAETSCKSSKDLEQTVLSCTLTLEKNPAADWADTRRAHALNELDRSQDALHVLAGAIDEFPSNAGLYAELGRARLAAFEREEAAASFDEALKLDPRNVLALVGQGDVHLAERRYPEALAAYDKAIDVDSGCAAAYAGRGDDFMNKREEGDNAQAQSIKNKQSAVADFRRAILEDPKNVRAYRGRANAHTELGEHGAAIEDFTQLIRLQPDDETTVSERGFAYLKVKNFDSAIADFTSALKDEEDLTSYSNLKLAFALAEAHAGKGEIDTAFAQLARIEGLLSAMEDPSSKLEDLYKARAGIHAKAGAFDHAVLELDRVLAMKPDSMTTRMTLSWVLLQAGDQDRGVAENRKLAEKYEKSPSLQANYGLALYMKGNHREAAGAFLKVVEIKDDPFAIVFRYLSLAQAGEAAASSDLAANAARLKAKSWPYAAIELFLEQRAPDAVMLAATTPDQTCQAMFYVGSYHLIKGNKDEAAKQLQTASGSCSPELMEGLAAKASAARLAR
jgi:tetratricopeptide (TPR) repeat protein